MATTASMPELATTQIPVEVVVDAKKVSAKRPRKAQSTNANAVVAEGVSVESQDTPLAESEGSMLVVAKSVRTYLKERNSHCGADVIPQLNLLVKDLVDAGIRRAQANQRKTLKAADM
jgi:hypothetical protein